MRLFLVGLAVVVGIVGVSLLESRALTPTPDTQAARAPALPPLTGKLGDPIQLFNGKDLEGWSWHTAATAKLEDVWSIKDGVMHEIGKPAGKSMPTGYLRIDKEYENFVLVVEQRHITKGNGGILVGITGPDKVWPRTLQVQGQFNDVGDFINQGDFKMTTDPARTTPRPANHDTLIKKIGPISEKLLGEWNIVELTIDHANIWVKVNGVLQNTATNVEPLPGKIGLQAEGAEMEFRKIELRPIIDSDVPSPATRADK